jgi:hypothetical protein
MNILKRLEKIVFVDVAPDLSSLKENDRKALRHCINAADIITKVYLDQISPQISSWREQLKLHSDAESRDLLQYFEINGGPWDLFNGDQSFLPNVGAKPKGGSFYPHDLTEKEWDTWLDAHSEDRERFESGYTTIARQDGRLVAIPYSHTYRSFLEQAATELKSAATFLPESKLKQFLELRADAFLTNNYFDSDLAWIDTDGYPFEVTIGPYEVYVDRLFGLKTMFEAFLGLPDEESTLKLKSFSNAVPDFDALLAGRFKYRPKGSAIPLQVVADVYRGGEAAFGRQFVAYNLPNDRRIHELKGSKKVFSRTMMEAKFSKIGQAIAERILKPNDVRYFKFHSRLLFVLGHELAHGLGPGIVRRGNQDVPFEILLRDLHSSLEEAKANALGVALLHYFVKRRLLELDDLIGGVITEIVQYIQEWRTGYTEAHSAGSLIEYNWLREHKALSYDHTNKVFEIEPERMLTAMEKLSDEFLRIQMEGSYDKAKAFVEEWGLVAKEIPEIVAGLGDLPYEVHPIYRGLDK